MDIVCLTNIKRCEVPKILFILHLHEHEDVIMNSLQKEETKFLTDGRKIHQQFLPLFGITGIILTVLDIVSDIVLALDYCVTDNPWWCGLTWTFIFIPMLAIIPLMYMNTFAYRDEKWKWTVWRIVQISFETDPQLLLQLHIIVSSRKNPSPTSGKSG